MKLVDRYLLRAVIMPACFGLGMFSSLLLASFLLRHVDELFARGVPAPIVAKIFACYVPEVLVSALPMAVLFATLTAVGQLAADSELTALRAGGLSLQRVTAPVVLAGLIASGVAFALDEWLVPWSRAVGQQTYYNEVTLKNPLPKVARNVFFDGGGAFKMFVREVDRRKGELRHVTIFQLPHEGAGWPRVTEAARARLGGEVWTFRDGTMTASRTGGAPEHFIHFREWSYPLDARLGSPIPEPNPQSGDLPLPALAAEIEARRAAGRSLEDLEVRYWFKVAFPLASLAMALLGAPLACRTSRSGAGSGIGLAVPLSIAYYIVLAVCRGAALAGKLHVATAMWTPNAITVACAMWLYRRASRQD